jgi:saccharopine dehydrogenase-like NADP-dependent oxidoreductase
MKIVLFGFGMQGKAAYYDLLKYDKCDMIIIADIVPPAKEYMKLDVENKASFEILDINNSSRVYELMKEADMVVDALPGSFAFHLAKMAVETGVHLVSSMYYLNPLEKDSEVLAKLKEELKNLYEEAIRKNITVLPEFGLDPGIDLVLGAKAISEFEEVEVFNSYGTGIPVAENADNPLKYKFSWSIPGVLRAYRRPSRIILNGKIIEIDGREIFSTDNRHMLEIEELKTPLECYPNGNSEYYSELFGLKYSVKEMGRYACRYPGHCDFWYTMSNSGFLDDNPLNMGNVNIPPIEFVANLLASQKQFHFGKNESDIAMVRVEVTGKSLNKKKKMIYQLIDYKDQKTGFTAMQRTVGFTMSLGARLILNGQLNKPGLISPIEVPFEFLEEGLKEFGMHIKRIEIPVNE